MRTATILIADPNAFTARVLARAATRFGLRALLNMRGNTVAVAKKERPTLILLNLEQPDHDGRDVLAALKSDPATAHIEVVVMSEHADAVTENECLALGALDFVEKPVSEVAMASIARLANAEDPMEVVAF